MGMIRAIFIHVDRTPVGVDMDCADMICAPPSTLECRRASMVGARELEHGAPELVFTEGNQQVHNKPEI